MAPEDVVTPISGSGSTALHLALKKSDVVYGKLLLEAAGDAFDVDAVDTKGRSLLAVGLMMGSPTKGAFVKLLRHLLDMSGSHCPLTVLSWKAVTRFVDVSLLLSICRRYDSDYFVNTTPEDWEGGTTPLHCACYPVMAASPFYKGDDIEAYRRDLAALLELLPEWFVVVGKGGYTPLHCAVASGNAVAVELLLDLPSAAKAAEIALECDEPDHQHAGTPLEVAVRIAHASVVRMFLAMVPGIRSVPTTSGQSLSEFVDSLHAGDSWTFAAVKAAFVPAVKSAAQ
jgi:ankyrin repeat protein